MKVAALCDFPYWEGRVGTAVRMESLCRSLVQTCDLSMISSLTMPEKYRPAAAQAPYDFYDRRTLKKIHNETPDQEIAGVRADRQVTVKGIKHLVEIGDYDAVLIPYFNRAWMIEHIRPDILRIVDTHDCQSQRTRSFAAHGLISTFPITPEEEGVELNRYDMALALSDEDQTEFSAITRTPVITAPFRLRPKPIYSVRETASEAIFTAARSNVNDMTLVYLMEEVLPLVTRAMTLHVVGNVTIPKSRPPHIKLVHHENVEDLEWIYRAVDLALNPTYAGGGVKTKTLEAIAYGVPVLTSDEGARGLRDLLPDELIANDKETFSYKINDLLGNPTRRGELSQQMINNLKAEDSNSWLSAFSHILGAQRAHKTE
jgi:glycosyltransferase involved in cell wall biosynthesis